ncbi:glycosyltransferase [Cellulosilyticum sp. I15G10I2]|uniref:glycosyltransferase n=1 Tax=Cellulosilyticum sp. I15G10I2 TaxID=1892843 RepID=UPI00085C8E82|nr:glycosyltransferase [Cellulosilyticum sp. I15G10I2]
MDLISIIVPIYNVEKYLAKCLDSILAQTIPNIEIILINDGSLDSSLVICKHYAAKDKRICVVDKINEGVAQARNTGLDLAKGNYIGFVDPDDWIEPQMYESMYNKLVHSEHAVCLCNYYKNDRLGSSPKFLRIKKDILNKQEVIDDIVANMIGIDDLMPKYTYIMGCVWRCLYKKEFIDKHNLRFKKGVTIMEDLVFTVEALLKSDGLCIDHGVWYHYRRNPKSVLHSYNPNMWEDQIYVHHLLEELLKKEKLADYMLNRLDIRYIGMAFCAIYNATSRHSKENRTQITEKMKKIRAICNDEKLKRALDRVKPIQKPSIFK